MAVSTLSTRLAARARSNWRLSCNSDEPRWFANCFGYNRDQRKSSNESFAIVHYRPLDQSDLEFHACVCQHPWLAAQSVDKGCQVAVVQRAHDLSHGKSLPGADRIGVPRQPPMGVTVLPFEIEVTGAALQPSDSSKQPVSMLSEPEDIELEHLQTESALLASKSVPTGTYNGLVVSFANPKMTIQNQTGMSLTLGGQMCADKQVCEFNPKLNQSSATVQAPAQPFPITLAMNSPIVLKMDFNIDSSIQQSDLPSLQRLASCNSHRRLPMAETKGMRTWRSSAPLPRLAKAPS